MIRGSAADLGLTMASAAEGSHAKSPVRPPKRVVVLGIHPTGRAARLGIDPGDVILDVGGKAVATAGDVRDAITAARTDSKNSVLMRVKSGGSLRFVAVPVAKG